MCGGITEETKPAWYGDNQQSSHAPESGIELIMNIEERKTGLPTDRPNEPTKFHENWSKNVTSNVFTCFHYIHIEKNAPPTGGHVFSPISTIFEHVRDIN
ncbi:hypothetical protein DPMN_146392 [Dreissena polymorpha]|uniref:Uncharacterized protein n=1 Tax=Dreissena polymorpha TaxID=45954 RepID=A0A9D4IYD4_DREPO|nr:hypothetical protein DPMN_146392 [Dreissena polymorpha]